MLGRLAIYLFIVAVIVGVAFAECRPMAPVVNDMPLVIDGTRAGAPIGVRGEAVFERGTIVESVPEKVGHHAVSLAALDDGALLAAWYSYRGPDELAGSAIYLARRAADATAWGPAEVHLDRPVGDGNPVLYVRGDDVWLFSARVPMGWASATIEVQRSRDRGRTWTAPRSIGGPLGGNVKYPPVRVADGGLLLPAYDDLLLRSLFFYSEDGETWGLRSTIVTRTGRRAIQPSVARVDGRLVAVMRNTGQGFLWAAESDDGGRSWTRPIDSGFANPGSAAALISLESGRLLLVFNDDRRVRKALTVALSADGGATWPHRRVLADGPATYSYPSAVQAADGRIHIGYSEGRERLVHVVLNEAWIVADR